jgi:hypothetical protein
LCPFFDPDEGFIPPLPNGIALAFPGNCPGTPSDWTKPETGPLPRLAVAGGFDFSFGNLRLLTHLCPILFSSMEWFSER